MTVPASRRLGFATAILIFCGGLTAGVEQATAGCQPTVTDPRGDAVDYLDPRATNRDDADILAVDLHIAGGLVTVTARLATTASRLSLAVPGRLLDTEFRLTGREYDVYWYSGADGMKAAAQDNRGPLATTMQLVPQRSLIRLSFRPRETLGKTAKLSDLVTYASDLYGTNEQAEVIDLDQALMHGQRQITASGCIT